ncbi:MAG: cobalamin B12-binding domain-containing protein [Verrucomicrobia bacterium]|nr:cobalamin B12-binding domain-containing protein [Verrucomicrobiota bacterium]
MKTRNQQESIMPMDQTNPSIQPMVGVCLINPPSPFLLDERVFPSLGLLKVAASLELAGHSVHVLDLSGVQNFLDVVDNYLNSAQAQVIGLTATTPQLPSVIKIVERIRKTSPHTRIILGGPHVTLVSSAAKMEKKTRPLRWSWPPGISTDTG